MRLDNLLQKSSDSEELEQITVRVPSDQLQIIEKIREKSGTSRAEACRKLISRGLQERNVVSE